MKHRDTKKHAAVKLWSEELYDILVKADNEDKLPEIVVSSKYIQKVPVAMLSSANEVVPLSTRIEIMENQMKELLGSVTKFVAGKLSELKTECWQRIRKETRSIFWIS